MNIELSTRKIAPRPKTPRPTTESPITAPPLNAILRALFIPLSLAAFAVRTFAIVATVIPKYPARVENNAPKIKHSAVPQLITKPIVTNSTAAKITRILYSENKNALAPVEIAEEIFLILSVP